jgi:hypothetical protein
MAQMSFSESSSKSVSSITAIMLHYKEAYGFLLELGFKVRESRFTDILPLIEDGYVDRVQFLGLNSAGEIELAFSIHIDWEEHMLIVQSGDAIRLPIRSGVIYLQQVRAVVEEFMKVFDTRGLEAEFRAFLRRGLSEDERSRLKNKYGFTGKPRKFTWAGEQDSYQFTSRYHPAVSFRLELGRPREKP